MLRRLYLYIIQLSASPYALVWLFGVAFAEASFFPIPVDILLAPIVLARRDHAWRAASICTLGSVIGGLFGWLIGAVLLHTVALPIVNFYHASAQLTSLQQHFNTYGFWIILAKGFTPIPYKLVTIAAGIAHYPLIPFVFASILTRGARFFLVAGLLKYFGPTIERVILQRITLWFTLFLALVIVGIILVKYL